MTCHAFHDAELETITGYFTRVQGSESDNQTALYGMGTHPLVSAVSALLCSMHSQFDTSLATIDAGGLQVTSGVGPDAAAVKSNSLLTGALPYYWWLFLICLCASVYFFYFFKL